MRYDPNEHEDDVGFERMRTLPAQRRDGRKVKRKAHQRLVAKRREYHKRTVDFFQSATWLRLRSLVKRIYGHRCMRCGHTGSAENKITVDHIVPRARTLASEALFANLQVLCACCNKAKGRTTVDYRPRPLPPEATRLIVLQQMHSIDEILGLVK